jgi:hypothetical protein
MGQPSRASKPWSKTLVILIIAPEEKDAGQLKETVSKNLFGRLSRRFCVDRVKLERQANVSKLIRNTFAYRQMGFYMAESLLINAFAGK